jgi:hypothetical protein
VRNSPSRARTATTDSSRSNGTNASRIDGAPAELALAVVAEAARLEDRRRADRFDRAREVVARIHRGERGRVEADFAEQALLGEAILRGRERTRVGEYLRVFGEPVRGVGRHVLEIEGRHVDAPREIRECVEVAPVRAQHRRDLRRTRVLGAVDDEEAQAERRTREREHARELAATEHADRSSGVVHRRATQTGARRCARGES